MNLKRLVTQRREHQQRQKMLMILDAPGSRMIILVFLKSQDGEDTGPTQLL